MTVTTTIRSHFDPKIIYAHAGETVRLIADHGNVLIVENMACIKFPVPKDLTDESEVYPKSTSQGTPERTACMQMNEKTKQQTNKRTKPAHAQPSLF